MTSVKREDNIEEYQGVKYRYSSEWIHQIESQEHWTLYWHQLKLMEGLTLAGDKVLEIGVGSGFTANYLTSKGYQVTTLDIDEAKKPNIKANIVSYSFKEKYDYVLAFEVFEHIPFEEFLKVLQKLKQCCQKYIFLSVPNNSKTIIKLKGLLPFIGDFNINVSIPKKKITEPHHFWEVNHGEVSQLRFENELARAGLKKVRKTKVDNHLFYAFKSTH